LHIDIQYNLERRLWGRINTHSQSFKNTFLSKNLDQNMHKNALIFEKSWKIAAALGLRPQTPVGFRGWGFCP